jgi:DNA-binding LacI/PurR family transcriptional regulator
VKFTTIVQPMQEMSVMALEELIRLSKNPLAAPTSHIQKAHLILRQSTAAPFSSQRRKENI